MKISKETLAGYDYIKITLTIEEDKEILNKIKEKARNDAGKVNKKGPDGQIRSDELINYNNLGGVLAEEAVKIYLRKVIEDNKINAKIIPSVFEGHLEHRDIKIKVNEKIKTIEIRSSFQYRQPDFTRVLSVIFSLIGPYTTSYKGTEPNKDFYITVLHRYRNPEIITKIDNEVEVFIVGGASEELFNEIGEGVFLKQEGAKYLAIKPINKTKGVNFLTREILEIK